MPKEKYKADQQKRSGHIRLFQYFLLKKLRDRLRSPVHY